MIRKALPTDIEPIMKIVAQAQARLAAAGVDQWQDGYPTTEILLHDIASGNCYIAEKEGVVAGFMVIMFEIEPTYNYIEDGQWLTYDRDYCVIHRIAFDNNHLRQGLCTMAFNYAEQLCRERGVGVVRIDTHRDNVPMNASIKKHGFSYCGVIYLRSGAKRLAYEKVID